MKNLFDLTDRVVVITGATGVLGAPIVRHFVAQGARVVLLARDEKKASLICRGIEAETLFIPTDVLSREDLLSAYQATISRWSRVDVLINCAGGNMSGATLAPEATIFDLDLSALHKVVDLNLFGTILPTMIFARSMAERGEGSIINFASLSALRPLTRVAGYGVAKAAVVNFTKYMCGELASKFGDKVRINAIAPGFFLTDQNRDLLTLPDGSLSSRARQIIAHTPFARFGKADELLGTLQYLASDASSFVSGTVAVVDGGFDAFSI
ncbi:MAG: SDR family oxidoreductase [Mucinivorans sp.]